MQNDTRRNFKFDDNAEITKKTIITLKQDNNKNIRNTYIIYTS